MTPYAQRDLAENWEFKILRSVNGKFRNPVWLHGVLEEEARAGWTMVEKFDDSRIRLKRPASARVNDSGLGFDPYRTYAGMSQTRYGLLVLLITFCIIGIIAGIAIMAAVMSPGGR